MELVVLRLRSNTVSTLKLRPLSDPFSLIVEPYHIGHFRKFYIWFREIHRKGSGACGILLFYNLVKQRGHSCSFFCRVLLSHFVSIAPHDDRRVIPVTTNKRAGIGFCPLRENKME